jgi:hypothetical protein
MKRCPICHTVLKWRYASLDRPFMIYECRHAWWLYLPKDDWKILKVKEVPQDAKL